MKLQHRAVLGGRAFGVARLNKARLAGLLGDDTIVWKNIVYLDSDVTLLCVKPDWMIHVFLSCTYRGLRRCDSGPAQNFFDLPFSRLAPRGFCRQSGCGKSGRPLSARVVRASAGGGVGAAWRPQRGEIPFIDPASSGTCFTLRE